MRSAFVALFIAIATVAAAAAPPENSPAIAFDGQHITVSGVTPGSDVVVFALALDPDGFESTVVRWAEIVSDTARTGSVVFDARRDIPRKSIWTAVDLSNGQYAMAAPPGHPLRKRPWPTKPFHADSAGHIDEFRADAPFVDMLYVHPGRGAWVHRAHDGDTTDADGKPNGLTTLHLSTARSLNALPNGPELLPGGVLIVIDFYHLNVAAARLDGALLQELW